MIRAEYKNVIARSWRRSNLLQQRADCHATLAMTGKDTPPPPHRYELQDDDIHEE
ncbi:MAG: hypothetical protein ACK5IQ_09835 [Bacteroidales bacterium]